MPRQSKPRGVQGAQPALAYWDRSKQPLEILGLVLPLVLVYEVGLIATLRLGHDVLTNRAHEGLLRVFAALGVRADALSLPALALPALALVVVLVAWQVVRRTAWTVHLPTVGLMAIESALAALPLAVVGELLTRSMAAAVGDPVAALPLSGKIAVAIGAGLYEEFVFRMCLLAFLHTVLVDLLRTPERVAMAFAIVASAALFALYHPLRGADGALQPRRAAFFFIAGLWFGVLFAVRGFGIAVGAHAAYDMLVVAVLEPA